MTNQENEDEITVQADSQQLEIFRNFYGKDADQSTNLFNAWDFYGVYAISRREQIKMRKLSPNLPITEHEFHVNGYSHAIEITPAIITVDGQRVEYYPSEREEIVEQALRRIFLEEGGSVHVPGKETWVRFTLKQVQNELSRMGHGMSIKALKESLDIMIGCKIKVSQGRKKAFEGSILTERIFTDREEYLETGKSVCAAKFNTLITDSIDKLEFRQMNYLLYMSSKRSVTRWIYKLLVSNYRNAGYDAPPFRIRASQIIQACRLTYTRERDAYKEIRLCLEELRGLKDNTGNNAVIPDDTGDFLPIQEKQLKQGAKIVDLEFTITASAAFIAFVKAANRRSKDLQRITG